MKTVVDLTAAIKEYILGKDQDVEKIIAPVEADATSSAAAHAIGDQIIVDNVLYNVTAAIAIGDAITAGTNIQAADKVTDQIEAKQDQMQLSAMPVASADYASKVVIYIGTTTADYTSGQSYQCVESSGSYSWEPTTAGTIDASNVNYDGTSSGSSETTAQGAIDDLYDLVGTTTTKTLAANATTIQFDAPTTGDNLVDFFSSDGSNYTGIDSSVSGKVTLTFIASESDRTISCRISEI